MDPSSDTDFAPKQAGSAPSWSFQFGTTSASAAIIHKYGPSEAQTFYTNKIMLAFEDNKIFYFPCNDIYYRLEMKQLFWQRMPWKLPSLILPR